MLIPNCCKRISIVQDVTFAILAALLAFLVAQFVYQNRPLTSDENSYLFQAQCFADGIIARPAPEMPEAFHHEMIILNKEAGWLSRYPPGHGLWLIPGVLIQHPRFMSFVGAAIGIMIMGAIGRRLDIRSGLIPLLMVVSPFYVFIYGSLLSHTSGFIASAAMLFCYIRWQQTEWKRYAALAGMFWGFLFLNRTFTALLLVLPYAIDALATLWHRRSRSWFLGCILFGMVPALFILIYLEYNNQAVGHHMLSTYLYYDPSENLGFGLRHTGGVVIDHTVLRGLQNTWHNIKALDIWLWGSRGGLVIAGALSLIGWNRRWSPLCIGTILTVCAGYIYFWFPGIEHLRPLYYFEILPFLFLSAAFGVQRIGNKLNQRPILRLILLMAGVIYLIAAAIPFVRLNIRDFYNRNAEQAKVARALQKAPTNALVFLEGFSFDVTGENMLNIRGVHSDPLVVRSAKGQNSFLANCYSNRTPYVLYNQAQLALIPFEKPDLIRYDLPACNAHLQTGANQTTPEGDKIRIATQQDGEGLLFYGFYRFISEGKWIISFHFSMENVTENQPVLFEIASQKGTVIMASEYAAGTRNDATLELIVEAKGVEEIEPRVYYGGSGILRLTTVHIEQSERDGQ